MSILQESSPVAINDDPACPASEDQNIKYLSHALAGRKFRGISTIFLDFILRSDDHTTCFGNVYGQSHSFRILVHLSEVVIPYVYPMEAKHSDA